MPSAPDASSKGGRPSRALWWIAAPILVGALLRLGVVVADQLAWPFDLRFETPNMCTVQAIRDGLDPYSPSVYADAPFVLTQYAPLYLWLVAGLPSVPGRPFLVGRCVSVVAMLLAAALLFRADGRRTPRALAALGLGWFFLLHAQLGHTADFRADALALALSVSSLVLVVSGGLRRVALAALLGSLAIATKQSSVAAAAAGLIYLWFHDRRAALLFGGLAATLLCGGALAATLHWGEGFWFSLLLATRPPKSLEVFVFQWSAMLRQPAFAALLLAGLVVAVRSARSRMLLASPWPAYALLSGVVLLAMSSTNGTHEGHFLEFGTALLYLLVFTLGRQAPAWPGRRIALASALLCAALAAHELIGTWTDVPSLPLPRGLEAQQVRERQVLVRASLDKRQVPHRNVLGIGITRDASAVADRVCLSPGWLYDQLWNTGDLSPAPVVAAVQRHAFDVVVVTTAIAFPPPADDRAPRADILRAISESYEPVGTDSVFRYFRPR